MSSEESRTRIPDGNKFVIPQGTRAIKGGIRPNAASAVPDVGHKPTWLRVRLPRGAQH
jgi:lipoic acid synthetase